MRTVEPGSAMARAVQAGRRRAAAVSTVAATSLPAGGEAAPVVPVPTVAGPPLDARQRAAVAAYRLCERLVGILPHRAAYGLAAAVGTTVAVLQPRRFDGLRANLRHVLPDADPATVRRIVRANARNLARSWVDVMEMFHRPDAVADRVRPIDLDNLLGPSSRGKGVLVVSLHLGSWEAGLAGWNRRFGRMALLAEVLEPRPLFERVLASRERLGVEVIPLDAATMRRGDPATARRLGAAALRRVYRILRSGGMVAVAIDRDITGTGEPFSFFGAPAPITTGAVEVAMRAGAAIVPIVLFRTGRHHDCVDGVCYAEVAYDATAPDDAEVRRVVGELLRILETVIRAHPDQWHVLDPIWEERRDGAGSVVMRTHSR